MVITSCYCLLIAPQTNQTEFSSLWYNAFSKGMNTFALFGNETGKTLAGLKPEHLYRWYFCSIRKYIEFRTSAQLFSAKNCSCWKLYVKRRSAPLGGEIRSLGVRQDMKTAIRDKIFETSGVGQAPSKDFFHLTVTRESIIWRSWRITLRSNKSLPGETTHSWDKFVNDSKGTWLQGEIRRVFGVETLNIVLAMVTQTWLPYLKSDILTEILVRLDLRDIMRLAQVRYLKLL